jgi:peptidoglycan-N-acetylglucosamine deacetylase
MIMKCAAAAAALALAASTARAQVSCPGNADALGTARVLQVDMATPPRVGRKQFPQTLPLAPREVVLTFDDGPRATSRLPAFSMRSRTNACMHRFS